MQYQETKSNIAIHSRVLATPGGKVCYKIKFKFYQQNIQKNFFENKIF